MLPFLKRKTESAGPQSPAWHPNFRNYERLPDIKVVRTAFFVNGAAVFVAAALAVYLGMREYELRSYNQEIRSTEQQIETNRPGSEQAVALYKLFQDEEAKTREVSTFVESRPRTSEIVQRFAVTRPANIVLEVVEIRENGISVRASVRSGVLDPFADASNYLGMLRADPYFTERIEEVTPTGSPSRNPSTGQLHFEIFLKFKAAPTP